MAEGLRYEHSTTPRACVRAYDVRTGKQLWRFNTMPRPGEFGNDTWENGSWDWTGNTGVWTEMSADPEAGLVYLPVESPTIDVYGGNRPGNRLFAESLVARRSEDRQAQVAFPDRAPPDLGLRHCRRAAARGRRRSTASRASSSRSRASRAGCMCSIASPASRSGRCRRSRCRSPTCRERRRRRRSRSRASRRPTRATTWRRTT